MINQIAILVKQWMNPSAEISPVRSIKSFSPNIPEVLYLQIYHNLDKVF